MSIKARVQRLERCKGACGPACPPRAVSFVGDDWYGQTETQGQPAPCARCGRPADVIGVVFDPNFYGNADRLRERTT
jgi:hypothetical protein